MNKIAVVLFNLGGPDSKEAIRPFLFNFFMDKNIIRLPYPLRWILAKFISYRRLKGIAGRNYELLGNKSPLLENTIIQAEALEKKLGDGFKVFVTMRYWHPMAQQVARDVKEWGADKIVLLPLYPQFSITTTGSSFSSWNKAMNYKCPISTIYCYPEDEGFIKASVENIMEIYKQAQNDGHINPRVLFSAHGLPEDIIKSGDPYQSQCEQSALKIAEELNIENLDWAICYQSRIGPKKWIGPSIEEELHRAANDRKAVIIYPHSFTQEHVETLVEIDIEYRKLAIELKIPGFYRVKTVSDHLDFINGLARMVIEHLNKI